jgi:hypothetical protein
MKLYDILASFMTIWGKPVPKDKFRLADQKEDTVRRFIYEK